MKFIYSTPEDYVKEIYKKKAKWPENDFDFFPYADSIDAYWTGYFTSRVEFKGMIRESGRYLNSFRKLVGEYILSPSS